LIRIAARFGLTVAAVAISATVERKVQAAPPSQEAVGAEYRDSPEWLVEQRRKDAEERHRKELEDAAKSDDKDAPGYIPGYQRNVATGLSPHAPQFFSALPGALTPAFGAPKRGGDFRFDFHGYLQASLRAGIGQRDDPGPGQNTTTIHGDPVVAGASFGWFDHTNTVLYPWAQLNFSYGNDVVTATAIIAAWSFAESDEAAQYFNPPSKVGLQDVFMTYRPRLKKVNLQFLAGVYPERYGGMAQYDQGAYNASIIGSIFGVGGTGTLQVPLPRDFGVSLEAGVKGDFNTPVPVNSNTAVFDEPGGDPTFVGDQSNEFARAIEGSTYAAHVHLGWNWKNTFRHTVHYIGAMSADSRKDSVGTLEDLSEETPHRDATLTILGTDVRYDGGRFGHLYLGASHILGRDTESISNLVQILNTGGGQELMQRYWGAASRGNGTLSLAGAQYSLSLGTLLRHPEEFWGIGPDLTLGVFGIFGYATSIADGYDNHPMMKYGVEATYAILPWFAVSGRFDHVLPDLGDNDQSFMVLSPRILFRTQWKAQETISIQYAGYLLGDDVVVNGDNRFLQNPSGEPDRHMVLISGTMWW